MRRTNLEAEYDWYIAQANDPGNPPEIRNLWKQLAEGLAPRLPEQPQEEGLW